MRRVLLPAALVVVASCFSGYDTRPESALRVHRGTFVQTIVLTGELQASRGVSISVPALSTWQTSIKWLAQDGDEVKAGERVAELDNGTFTTDLDSKRQLERQALQELQQKDAEWEADLGVKVLDLEKKRGELEKAKIEAAIPSDLLSARDYEDRQMKSHRAATEFAKASEILAAQRKSVVSDRANLQLKLARAAREVKTAEEAIELLTLRAPRAGIVVVHDHPWEPRKLQSGDGVWVGFPLAQIPDLDSLEVAASLPDVDDGRVAVGMPATVTMDGYPSLRFPGMVKEISAVAQEGTRNAVRRAFRVVVDLGRVDANLMRPGLSARVEIRRRVQRNALIVPRAAVDLQGRSARALLPAGKSVEVKLGECNAQECVVVSGLEEGAMLRW
jgi:HlyD family secretion protein